MISNFYQLSILLTNIVFSFESSNKKSRRVMITSIHLLTPVTDHEETEYHTTEMGNMCHTIATGSQGREELADALNK
jgi:hypothetical protein